MGLASLCSKSGTSLRNTSSLLSGFHCSPDSLQKICARLRRTTEDSTSKSRHFEAEKHVAYAINHLGPESLAPGQGSRDPGRDGRRGVAMGPSHRRFRPWRLSPALVIRPAIRRGRISLSDRPHALSSLLGNGVRSPFISTRRWAHVTAYPIGIGSLAVLVILLNRLTRRSLPLAREPLFWSTTLALALSSRFIIRELPECGPNLLMVALAWGAIALWRRGRDDVAGLCLGLAIALKCTQALFVPYFVLKRQWRMVGATTAFTLLFSVLPVLRQGPALYERHLAAWGGNCWKGLRASDPSVGVLGQEEVWNVALKPTLARYLMHLPAGHKGASRPPGEPSGSTCRPPWRVW